MSQTYYTILTKLGAELLANATALGIPLKLTQMAVGDGNGAVPKPIANQTSLIHEVRRAAINSLSVDNNNHNQIIAEQVIPENEGGWFIHEIGLFDDKGNLIAVGNCPPTYKPQLTEGSGRTQIIRMIIIIDNIDSVELKIDPSVVLATREYVDDSIELLVPASRKINNKKLENDIILSADDINALPASKKMSGDIPTYEVNDRTNFKKRPNYNGSELISKSDFNVIAWNPGFEIMPSGLIRQWGAVQLYPIREFNSEQIGDTKFYTNYYEILLPIAFPHNSDAVNVTLACTTYNNQSSMCGNSVSANLHGSPSKLTIAVTSPHLGFNPVVHFEIIGH
ncbi:phage tail protein [Gilliamella sp. Pra-s65]|uniref:phage tail protein n=1 Tax=unclassified Gilliamella TaxID=2685620 RepID=UPI00136563DC|nr:MULTISPECIES: phage tail protein [unclassified Gilliamella]MWN89861.1 phage tail protein [Gilliamella sp. Pra-s65]MWP73033.1 phage tail protein [Gilliamella sp. Pra-s52]